MSPFPARRKHVHTGKGENMLAEVIGKAQGFERCAPNVRMKLILAGISYGLDPSQLDNLVYKT